MTTRRWTPLKGASLACLLLAAGACAKGSSPEKNPDGKGPAASERGKGAQDKSGHGKGGQGKGGGPQAVRVETAALKTSATQLNVIAPLAGRTQADVYAKVVGRLSSMGPKEGEAVKRGDVLFRIDRADPGESFLSTPVTSPLKGWIGRWHVLSLGEQVTTQAPVVTVVDDEVLRATVYLPTREWMRVDRQTAVTLDVGGTTRSGRVVTIARSGDAASGRGGVTVEVDNPDRLWRAGMVARIGLGLEPKPRIIIPSSALILTDQGAFVYVAENDVARRAAVEFRLIDSDSVEITSGIKDQDQVVIAGTNQLSDKAAIRIAPASGQPTAPPAPKGG